MSPRDRRIYAQTFFFLRSSNSRYYFFLGNDNGAIPSQTIADDISLLTGREIDETSAVRAAPSIRVDARTKAYVTFGVFPPKGKEWGEF